MNKDLLNAILAGILVLAIGLTAGYSLGYYRGAQNRFPKIEQVGEINSGVATLNIEGVENGKMVGQVVGQKARIVIGQTEIMDIPVDGRFEIPVSSIGRPVPSANIPPEAQFVASERGKYYYSVLDLRSQGLALENRLYFGTAEQAEAKGFEKAPASP